MKRPQHIIPFLLTITTLLAACGTPAGGVAVTSTVIASATVSGTETPIPPQTSTPLPADAISTFIISINDNGYNHLFIFAPGRLRPTRITNGQWDDVAPSLSPDGQKIVFASDRNDYWDIYLLDLNTAQTSRLTDTPEYDGNPTWSPDGQWVVFETYPKNKVNDNLEIAIISTVNTGPAIILSNNAATDSDPVWSSGGRKIAFVSDRTGEDEIWVADLDQPDQKRFVDASQSANGADTHPAWSPDGTKLAWASARPNQPESIYVWDAKSPGVPAQSIGAGSWPAWNETGDQITTRFQQPNQDYLTTYNLDGGMTMPILPLPVLHGLNWRIMRINKLPGLFQKASGLTPTPLFKGQIKFETPIPGKRAAVVAISNVKAPHPFLHDAVDEAFVALRQRVIAETGWDTLASLADAYEPLTSTLDPGKGEDWLYTGRAFALNSLTLNVGWMQVIREDINGQTYWRVYLRALAQDGSQGTPLPSRPWDLNARYNLDPQSYDQGGLLMKAVPTGYWVDFTDLASQYGWQRIPAQNNWRTYYTGTQFNEFVRTDGLEWRAAMLQLYPADIFITPTVIVLPTGTRTKTPIAFPYNSPTPTITLTPTPHPTFTPAP